MSLRVSTLFFDMNSFFASVAQQEEPTLIGRPVGVLTTDSPGAACIAASIEAKRRGVRMGSRQHEARLLCPGIVFRPAKHDVCVEYHHAIRAAVETVLPIEQAHSVDEFSCLLLGRQKELEAALDLARAVQGAILQQVGPAMRSSVGVAPNRLLAKIAAELEKPNGINWLHPSVMPDKIAHLALGDLPGISRGMRPRLEQAGIHDVRALFAMAPKQARHLWGNVTGERFLRELHGETVVWPQTQAHSLGHGQRLTATNRTPEGARLVARRLLVKAATRLRRQGMLARSLQISAQCAQHGRMGWSGNIQATQDSFFLLATFERAWAGFRLRQPLTVGVMLGGLQPMEQHIADLFEDRPAAGQPTRREALCAAIDALNQRYGQDAVTFGPLPPHRVPYTGAKIAFHRIPDRVEFRE